MIKVTIDSSSVRRMLANGSKQVRYAAAVALTRTAKDLQKKLSEDMRAAFKSASPYTLKSQFVRPAKRDNLEAVVGIKDKKPSRGSAPSMLVKEHFTGGPRGNKPMEKAMASISKVLPAGYVAIPGKGMPLDRYGNPAKARVKQILDYLRQGGNHDSVDLWRKGSADIGYFVVPVGSRNRKTTHLAPGIWRRIWRDKAHAVVPVFLFVKRAEYRKLFNLERMANDVIHRHFDRHYDAAFKQAMSSAR